MTKKDSIYNKISSIEKYLSYLDKFKDLTVIDLANSFEKKGAIERYVYLLAQSTIDLAEMIISYKKLRKPLTMSETFQILLENQIITPELTSKLIKMVGMRNILAHAYDRVDDSFLIEVISNSKKDIEEFVTIAEELI